MDTSEPAKPAAVFSTKQVLNVAIQLLVLAVLIGWCFRILEPFITPVIWAAILAITIFPLYQKLKNRLNQRGTMAAVIVTVLMLLLFTLPAIMFGIKTVGEIKNFATDYRDGRVNIPSPTEKVKEWPLIGNKVFQLWTEASIGIDSLARRHPEEVTKIVGTTFSLLGSSGKGVLLITLSIIISGVFLYYSNHAGNFAKDLFNKLAGNMKIDMASISVVTIRNVVKGILGVALIQSSLASVGFLLAGIPAAGIWTLCCLILAIIQVGILPVSIILIIYIWSAGTTLTATLFTIWMISVGLSDNILKPWLLGKGAPVPMLIVFLGSLGGFMLSGFIGLFTGAVILSLGYKLFSVWLAEPESV
jgi:predicted PurR-regulated permease PerM